MDKYVYVTGATESPKLVTEEFLIKQSLHWIGFGTDLMKENMYNNSISLLSNLFTIYFDDVDTIANDDVNRKLILGKLKFCVCRIKKLKALLHWAQKFLRILE